MNNYGCAVMFQCLLSITNQMNNCLDVVHTVPRICRCCSPSSSALIPALLSSSNTIGLSGCLMTFGGTTTAAWTSSLSCCSLGWSRDRPWPAGPSAAPSPAPNPASSGYSCFLVIAGFFSAEKAILQC